METSYLEIPDSVWANDSLNDGAKILWCFLTIHQTDQRTYTCKQLREMVGLCHNSLLKYLCQLSECNLLHLQREGSVLHCKTSIPEKVASISVPTELLFASALPHGAKWVWGIIKRLGQCVDYQTLLKRTDCTHESLLKYLHKLLTSHWITGYIRKRSRRFQIEVRARNPIEEKKRADIDHIETLLNRAASQASYSKGQCLMALMVKAITLPSEQLEDVKMTGLNNFKTSGRLELDLYIPECKIALEFQGPQHDGPTERYPGESAFKERRLRDVVKKGLSTEMGVRVIEVRAADLEFGRLRKLLEGLVPLRDCPGDERHVYEYLERVAAAYRRKAT